MPRVRGRGRARRERAVKRVTDAAVSLRKIEPTSGGIWRYLAVSGGPRAARDCEKSRQREACHIPASRGHIVS